jgi:hypothetical protein
MQTIEAGSRRGVTVRPIEDNDRAGWTPLWDGYNAFYGRSGETALAPEITETTWRRFFDPVEPVYYDKVAKHLGFIVYVNEV